MVLTWIVLPVLLFLSGFFSASQIAIMAVGRPKAQILLEQGKPGAKTLTNLLEDPNRVLSTLLIGNIATNVTASVLAASLFVALLGARGLSVAALSMIVALLVFGEILPKSYSARFPERLALAVARPISFLSKLFMPVIVVFSLLSNLVFRLLGSKLEEGQIVTEEEIRSLISIGHQQGVVEPEEQEILHSVFEFTDSLASEVMTPRLDMPAVLTTASVDEAANLLLEYAVSRIGVYEETPDKMIGVVHIEDVLQAKVAKGFSSVSDLVRPALVVPESKQVGQLFERMRKERISAAFVADEYGSVAGIITLEDLVEHIVGDLWDEHDREDDRIRTVDQQSSMINGRLSIDEINEAFNLQIPTVEAHTIGGWIFHQVGRLPNIGDVVEFDGVEFRVESMDRWRVDRVQVKKMVIATGAGATLKTDS